MLGDLPDSFVFLVIVAVKMLYRTEDGEFKKVGFYEVGTNSFVVNSIHVLVR